MLLGIDIGTTKAAAVVSRGGVVLASASRPHGADRPAPAGRAEQDAEALLAAACAAARELPESARRSVDAVGVTGQMHGVVVLDGAGRPLAPLVTWQDQRVLSDPRFLPGLRARTGRALRGGYGCSTLAWLAVRREMPAGAAAAATIQDLFVARLCGLSRPVTDPTDAAGWGLFDRRTHDWDFAAADAAGIPRALLPEVRPCGARAGALGESMAAALGLPPGIPVAVALGDNQASLLATLREPERELALTLGTGGQLSAVLPPGAAPEDDAPEAAFEYRPFPGGRTAAVAAALCGGSAWTWLPETVESWLRDLGLTAPPRDALFARLDALALAGPASLTVRPNFQGERRAEALRGAVEGIDRTNFTLGCLARGLARGIVENMKGMLPAEALRGRTRVVGSGNALRRSNVLQRAAEEVLGLPLALTSGLEEAAAGAALHAAPMSG